MATLTANSTVGGYTIFHEGNFTPDPGIDVGTSMTFRQSFAPTGWTKTTSHNDKMLRLTNSNASSGGTLGFSTLFSGSVVPSGSTDETTLTVSQIPSHTHYFYSGPSGSYTWSGGGWVAWGSRYSNYTGGDSSHTHDISTTEFFDMNVKYVDIIIASKD